MANIFDGAASQLAAPGDAAGAAGERELTAADFAAMRRDVEQLGEQRARRLRAVPLPGWQWRNEHSGVALRQRLPPTLTPTPRPACNPLPLSQHHTHTLTHTCACEGASGLDKRSAKAHKAAMLARLGAAAEKRPRMPAKVGLGIARKAKQREAAALAEAIAAGMVKAKGRGKKLRAEKGMWVLRMQSWPRPLPGRVQQWRGWRWCWGATSLRVCGKEEARTRTAAGCCNDAGVHRTVALSDWTASVPVCLPLSPHLRHALDVPCTPAAKQRDRGLMEAGPGFKNGVLRLPKSALQRK